MMWHQLWTHGQSLSSSYLTCSTLPSAEGYMMSRVVDFVPEAYVGAFPPFESDRSGKKLHKGGEQERGSRPSIVQLFGLCLFVCTDRQYECINEWKVSLSLSLSLFSCVIGYSFHTALKQVRRAPSQLRSSPWPPEPGRRSRRRWRK